MFLSSTIWHFPIGTCRKQFILESEIQFSGASTTTTREINIMDQYKLVINTVHTRVVASMPIDEMLINIYMVPI